MYFITQNASSIGLARKGVAISPSRGPDIPPNMPDEASRSSSHRAKRPRVLVACQRCKSRRQKCDNASPACSNCSRASVACIYSDHAYPSSYVKRLEERVRQLEAERAGSPVPSTADPAGHPPSTEEPRTPVPWASSPPADTRETTRREGHDRGPGQLALGLGVLSSCAAAEPHYFGFSAGLSLAHFVQMAIESGGGSADVSLPLLADRPFSSQAPKANAPPAGPPTHEAGSSYIRAYLSLLHPLYPFLNRRRIWNLHDRLAGRRSHQEARGVDKIDLTIMHLVYAVGSRCLQLLGRYGVASAVHEGHFLTAIKNIDRDLKFTSTKAIEITLLLGLHSMRSPYGTSVWHLSGLAVRQCLELGLHKQRAIDLHDPQLDQYRKRLFWSAYIFERKTALVLGRPFALSDEEIDLDVPANIDENLGEDAGQNRGWSGVEFQPSSTQRTSLSFHRYHVQLYQLHSQIRSALYRARKAASRDQVRATVSTLLEKLRHWHDEVLQTFSDADGGHTLGPGPNSHIFEEQKGPDGEEGLSPTGRGQEAANRPLEVEKSELLLEYHKARRSLLQPLMTESRQDLAFEVEDYAACAHASGQICQLYRRIHRLSPVAFTLRDLHAVFVAGFTLIYCVCSCPTIYSMERVSDVGACSTVLYVITEQWSSAKRYRDAFETIAEKMMDSARTLQQGLGAAPSNGPDQQSMRGGQRRRDSAGASSGSTSREAQQSGSNSSVPREPKPSNGNAYENRYESLRVPSRTQGQRAAPETVSEGAAAPFSTGSHRPTNALQIPGLDAGTYGDDSPYAVTGHAGLGLADADISDIERLLTNEGLDWFAKAVL
ncbi:hypothetical protein VTK73DRAFT_4336 [Phialemonium thermophilum]|uniref:Zn(2)-C6 fungal-type domain-containing protein n=1 Tax=Phialemonium thermophilum TaxID=223376 RepID=A0ABR3WUL8_9PEZI